MKFLNSQLVKEKAIVAGLFLVSFLLYFYQLESLPQALHNDEAETGLEALRILNREVEFIGVSDWYHLPRTSFLPYVFSLKIWGRSVFGLRAASALIGCLTVVAFFFLVKKIFSLKTALISVTFLTFSHYFVAFSRFGTIYNLSLLFALLTFYFLFNQRWFLTGIFTGSSIYLYFASRIVLLILLFYFVYLWWRKAIGRENIFAFLLGLVLVSWPMIWFYGQHREAFSTRVNNIYVFGQEVGPWLDSVYGGREKMTVLLGQMKQTFNLSSQGGDSSGQYGYRGRIFSLPILLLAIAGMIFSCWQWKERRYFFLLVWFWLTIIFGSLLVVPPSFMPRLLIALAAFYLFAAIALERINWPILTLAVIVFFILTNIKTYFFVYPQVIWGDGNKYRATEIGRYLANLDSSYKAYFFTQPALYANFATLRYLAPEIVKKDSREIIQEQRAVYVFYPEDKIMIEEVKRKMPRGKVIVVKDVLERIHAYVYQLD